MKRLIALLAAALALALPVNLCAAEEAAPRKVAYLTFDDGPNGQTPELLAVLEELDVPATFFLIGANVAECPEEARMILEAGHAVGCHSMNHSISRLRESTEYIRRDTERFMEAMRTHVDPAFTTDLYRFPGGSGGYLSRMKAFVRDMGFAWIDWNASNGDARFTYESDRELYEYTIKKIGKQDVAILLMHEGKKRTRRVLPDVVAYLRENGYEFRTLSTGEEERAILQRCSAGMMFPEREAGTETEGGV